MVVIGCIQHDCPKCRGRAALIKPRGITDPEALVLEWVVKGKSNEQIAAIIGKSTFTVKNQLASAIEKLGVSNRTSAAVEAIRCGLIDIVTLTPVKEI